MSAWPKPPGHQPGDLYQVPVARPGCAHHLTTSPGPRLSFPHLLPQPGCQQKAGVGANGDFKASACWKCPLFVFSHRFSSLLLKWTFLYVKGQKTFSVKGQLVTFLGFTSQSGSVAINQLLLVCKQSQIHVCMWLCSITLYLLKHMWGSQVSFIHPCSTEQTSVLACPAYLFLLLWVKTVLPFESYSSLIFKSMEYVNLAYRCPLDSSWSACSARFLTPQIPVSSRMKTWPNGGSESGSFCSVLGVKRWSFFPWGCEVWSRCSCFASWGRNSSGP